MKLGLERSRIFCGKSIERWNRHLACFPVLAWVLSFLWLGLICGVAFIWHLGTTGLIDETEPLFAEASRQMTVTGDLITPYFNNQTRFDKPPLVYWLMAMSYRLFGVNSWSVRLPSALAAIALTCLAFYTLWQYQERRKEEGRRKKDEGKKDEGNKEEGNKDEGNKDEGNKDEGNKDEGNKDEGRGMKDEEISLNGPIASSSDKRVISLSPPLPFSLPWLGSALIALNPETIAWGRTGVSDMLLTGCMCCSLLAFFLGYASSQENTQENINNNETPTTSIINWASSLFQYSSPWYLAFYILVALAILTKGPVGLILPLLIIASFIIYLGNWREVARSMQPLKGLLLIVIIALPWYILVTAANGNAFINSFFGYHNIERFTQVVNRHGAPWYFYFLVVLIGFAPWSVYLPIAIGHLQVWKRTYWRRQSPWEQLSLFAFFWFISIFLFFTIAVTKLPSYVLPLMPASAILLSIFWTEVQMKEVRSPKSEVRRGESEVRRGESEVRRGDKGNLHNPQFTNRQSPIANHQSPITTALIISILFNIVVSIGIAFVMLYGANWIDDPTMPNFAQLLQKSGILTWGASIWGLIAIGITLLLWKRQPQGILWINLIGLIGFLIFSITPASIQVDQQRQLPLRQLGQLATQVKLPLEEVIMIGFAKPSVVFYSQAPVVYLKKLEDAVNYIQKQKSKSPPTILILSQRDKLEEAKLPPHQYQLLGKAGVYYLIRVHK
jgi:4-amino-4-deoxy-L-arabinose transferase-like glycosyltransferase